MPEIVFVTNPDGATHDVNDDQPVVEWARNGLNGWRLATRTEIVACCKRNRIDPAEYLERIKEDN